MLLPDHRIRAYVETLGLGIEPFNPYLVQPASIDVLLGDVILPMLDGPEPIDPAFDQAHLFGRVEMPPGGSYVLPPHGFALASTHESVNLPANLVARVDGKSSIARLGLLVHVSAGLVDPGFDGSVTLELSNLTSRPWRLYPGMKIAQLVFEQLTSAAARPYGSDGAGSHYQGQRGPTCSRSFERFTYGLPTTGQE